MGVVNQSPQMKTLFNDIDKRIRKLEQSPEKRPYASFYDTTTQTAANTTTAYPVTFNTQNGSNLVTIASGSRVTPARTGVYNIQFSLQFSNTNSADDNIDIWFRLNGTDVAYSNSQFTVPSKHGAVNGHLIAALNFIVAMNAGQYVELMWRTASTTIFLETIAAATSPVRPVTPSAILTINEIAW